MTLNRSLIDHQSSEGIAPAGQGLNSQAPILEVLRFQVWQRHRRKVRSPSFDFRLCSGLEEGHFIVKPAPTAHGKIPSIRRESDRPADVRTVMAEDFLSYSRTPKLCRAIPTGAP